MIASLAYGLLLTLALPLAWVAALANPKLRAGLVRRLGWRSRFTVALGRRDPGRPLVWIHAASAGEFLQAEPLLRRFREHGAQLAVSLSSPSALPWLDRISDWPELVWADLMPPDFPGTVRRLIRGLNPAAILFVQADLWPGLVWGAAKHGVPQALFAARIGSDGNYRARKPLRWLYAGLYGRMAALLCASEQDRREISRIVPGHSHLEVTGDPGVETVLMRSAEAPAPELPTGWIAPQAPVLVVGSGWPEDLRMLVPALRRVWEEIPAFRVIWAPHEPTPEALEMLEGEFAAQGSQRLSQVIGDAPAPRHLHSGGDRVGPGNPPKPDSNLAPPETGRVLLVDRVGMLAGLYGLATVAYVGGGFGRGVHNVAEPAAFGVPIIFGPRHGNSAAAQVLLEAGAAVSPVDAPGLEAALLPWCRAGSLREKAGAKARRVVEDMAGAAEETFRAVLRALPKLQKQLDMGEDPSIQSPGRGT